MPFDAVIAGWFSSLDIPGDVEKDMDAYQQFGQLGSLILVISLILLLETPSIRRTVLDLICASALAAGVSTFLKMMFGRSRPGVVSEIEFHGPWFLRGESFELHWTSVASMPSGHSVAAAALAVYLAWIYPRLTILVMVLAAMVATWRVRVSAHYPSDVVAGLLLGALIATPIVHRNWGVRIVDAIWNRLIDTNSQEALPEVQKATAENYERYKNGGLSRKSALTPSILATLILGVVVLILANIIF